MGNDALDLAREKISQMGQETREVELADMPVQTVGIIVVAIALLLGLGRLPAMFWLIGSAVLSVRSSLKLLPFTRSRYPLTQLTPTTAHRKTHFERSCLKFSFRRNPFLKHLRN